jgi:COMPASS component SWD3
VTASELRPFDAVLGGKTPPPVGGLILGGILGVQTRCHSAVAFQRQMALVEALKYGEAGLGLIVRALEDSSIVVRHGARVLLSQRSPSQYPSQYQSYLAQFKEYKDFTYINSLVGISGRAVNAIALDGQFLISCGTENLIRVWSLVLGKQIYTLTGHTEMVTTVAIGCQKLLISGSCDRTIKIWDLTKLKNPEILTLTGHHGYVNSVALLPDGNTVVSGSQDTTIKFWDIRTGKNFRTIKGHTNLVNAVVLSPDGQIMATCSWNTTIKVWDSKTGDLIWELIGHSAKVWAFAITPDNAILISGSRDKTIKLWDLITGSEICTLEGHKGEVKALALSKDGQTLFSASFKEIKIWDLSSHKLLKTLKGHSGLIQAIALSEDGLTLVSAGADGMINIWAMA